MRLIQVVRIVKLGKRSGMFRLLLKALKQSAHGFRILLFLMALETIVFSTAMFYAEQSASHFDRESFSWRYNSNNSTSPFQSILDGFWWCIVTITTTGYGDFVPHSVEGKFVACIAMVCAIITFAFPITILGSQFSDAHAAYWEKKEERFFQMIREGKKSIDSQQLHTKLKQEVKELKKRLEATQKSIEKVQILVELGGNVYYLPFLKEDNDWEVEESI
eukprot:TRINITY_DN9255_c0_g1_i1.p1 TRINITY_DN9255_c0_g1~~TRINITY_DN9255_c0_g1_i1.p1  ORF type:complete len:219 (-),score=39.62 TRINITY_DN9255_c0_g1_i1:3-659(-)